MDKKLVYGVGAIGLIGIAYYLYNKNNNTTRSGNELLPPDNSMTSDATMGMEINPYPPMLVRDNPMYALNDPTLTGGVVAIRPSTPSGAGEVVSSTMDVTLFVDPPSNIPRPTPYTTYVVGSNSYYFADSTFFTNDVNSILSNASIPLTQKTSAINVLRQLAIDSVMANTAIYGGILGFTKKQSALDSINLVSDDAIAQVQSQLTAIVTGGVKTTPTTTTTTTTTSSPVLVKGFDGSFSYADGRRFRSRKNSLRGFKR